MVDTKVLITHKARLILVPATVTVVDGKEEWQCRDQTIAGVTPESRDSGTQHWLNFNHPSPWGGDFHDIPLHLPKGPLDALDESFRWVQRVLPSRAICHVFDNIAEGVAELSFPILPPRGQKFTRDFSDIPRLNLFVLEGADWYDFGRGQAAVLTNADFLGQTGVDLYEMVFVPWWMCHPPLTSDQIRDTKAVESAMLRKRWPLSRIEFEISGADDPVTRAQLPFPTWHRTPPTGSWEELRSLLPDDVKPLLDKWGALPLLRPGHEEARALEIRLECPDHTQRKQDRGATEPARLHKKGWRVINFGTFLMRYLERPSMWRDGRYVTLIRLSYKSIFGGPGGRPAIVVVKDGRIVSLKRNPDLDRPGDIPFTWVFSRPIQGAKLQAPAVR